jgi:3-phenylpropionate/trans-cinnamate dioxygenase ferredoxin subunit
MEFVSVCDVSELPENQMIKVSVDGRDFLLANLDGAYFAIANKCNHLGGSLANGTLEEKVVTCPRHGAQFDVTTGKSVGAARIAILKMGVKDQESYQVKVEGTTILLGLPE